MKTKTQKTIFFLLRWGISLGLILWLIRAVGIKTLFATFAAIPIYMVAYAYLLIFALLFLSAFRWWLLVREIPLFLLYRLVIVSVYYNTVLPSQLVGEFIKVYRLRHISFSRASASVIFDKVAGLTSLCAVATVGLFLTHVPHVSRAIAPIALGMILLLVFIFSPLIPIICRYARKITMICRRIPIVARHVHTAQTFFVAWAGLLMDRRAILGNITMGILFHVGTAYLYYVLGNTMHIAVPLTDWLWIYAFLSIVLLLPITIAGIGLREGTLVGILTFLGVSGDKAITFSLTILTLYIVVLLVGFVLDILYTRSVSSPKTQTYE